MSVAVPNVSFRACRFETRILTVVGMSRMDFLFIWATVSPSLVTVTPCRWECGCSVETLPMLVIRDDPDLLALSNLSWELTANLPIRPRPTAHAALEEPLAAPMLEGAVYAEAAEAFEAILDGGFGDEPGDEEPEVGALRIGSSS